MPTTVGDRGRSRVPHRVTDLARTEVCQLVRERWVGYLKTRHTRLQHGTSDHGACNLKGLFSFEAARAFLSSLTEPEGADTLRDKRTMPVR